MERQIINEEFNHNEQVYGLRYKFMIGNVDVRTAIARSKDVVLLKQDLKNMPYHIFGCHDVFREEICPRKHSNEQNHVVLLQHSNTFKEIQKCDHNIVRKTNHLKGNVTTNYAERYMSLVAKFLGSKRVNYSTGGSYSRRCIGAALAYNSEPSWHLSMIKNKPLNTLCARRERL
ncbi:hypothetical protein ILUMI_14026 [Ignelater luminosus]|uniref:Uncharacterized protein n=1 Tax=Ignelater luminosus TaxID=2038154 RepID=A0A8K0CXD1_IGNLU|nr:hypothetical protein ILUMI_14026 [Ignelater luminosus]